VGKCYSIGEEAWDTSYGKPLIFCLTMAEQLLYSICQYSCGVGAQTADGYVYKKVF